MATMWRKREISLRGPVGVDSLLVAYDLRSALRSLSRRPALTLVSVAVLALGLGVNTAVFSVVDAVLLRPLPAADPERLVYLVLTYVDRGGYFGVRYGDYELWRDASRSFSSLAAYDGRTFAVLGDGPVERVSGAAVTANYFETVGVEAVLGRAFSDDEAAAQVLPGVPIYAVATGGELVRGSYADRRLWTLMTSVFAALALGLGLIGLYGVTDHSVAGRTREIGIRMALGAWPRAVERLVVGQGLAPVASGIAAGVALALALTRFLESQLFGVSGRDPVTFLAGVVVTLATAAAVAFLPARRASRVDPAVAVRGVD